MMRARIGKRGEMIDLVEGVSYVIGRNVRGASNIPVCELRREGAEAVHLPVYNDRLVGSVSSSHVTLILGGEGVRLKDLWSKNGTYVTDNSQDETGLDMTRIPIQLSEEGELLFPGEYVIGLGSQSSVDLEIFR